MAEFTKEEKIKFLTLKYFGTTDNPQDDVNPYDSVDVFLDSTVGSLRWGVDATVRQHSKIRFADTFKKVLSLYRVDLDLEAIITSIQDDNKTNRSVIEKWTEIVIFPPRKSN